MQGRPHSLYRCFIHSLSAWCWDAFAGDPQPGSNLQFLLPPPLLQTTTQEAVSLTAQKTSFRYASRVPLSRWGSPNGTLRKVEPLPSENTDKSISPLLGRCICLRGSSRRTRQCAGLVDSSHDDITLIFHYLIHRDCAERTIKTSLGRQEPTSLIMCAKHSQESCLKL